MPSRSSLPETGQLVRYFVDLHLLPDHARPCVAIRHQGTTVLVVDPRSSRGEVARRVPDVLTVEEQNAGRDAYGEPDVGQPLDDVWMDERLPFPQVVPEPLRIPNCSRVDADDRARSTRH